MDNKNVSTAAKPGRLRHLDWLRVVAILLLFLVHTTRIFDTAFDFYIKNDRLSVTLERLFEDTINAWQMPLLFLLAGAATCFSLRRRSGRQYAKERVVRLLIPFIFGLLVIVPPQSYIGLLSHAGTDESFLQWYPSFFSVHPEDPDGFFMGGFTMAHLWFIAYLFIFSLLALPLFLYFKRDSGIKVMNRLAGFLTRRGMILLFLIPIILANMLGGYPNPLLYIVYFVYGYILFADPRFDESIDRHRKAALVLGPLMFAFLLVMHWTDAWPAGMPDWFGELISMYVDSVAPWFILLAMLVYGKAYLSYTNRFLNYAGEAGYPVYILHQTVIVVIGYYVVQWDTSILVKFLAILVAAFVVTVVLYDIMVKRTNVTRFLFGMRLKKKPEKEPAPRPSVA